ncbi:MAG: diguanylate cyclase [Deltaproteobacteria bacterium]|nr:MAG: diguanylate cyclase [Deltaproteobacteria bacterium]
MATLLMIEDSQTQRAEIRAALEPTGLFERIVEAHDGVSGLKSLLAEPIDVVLCDFEMPGLDGAKLLQVKESRLGDVPLLFLSGTTNAEQRVRLLDGGACDLVCKPFDAAELVARLRLHLRIKKLQDELRDKNQMLSHLSTTDSLTGLRSRRYFDELIQVEFLRARRYESPLGLLMADIDFFKRANDEHGHLCGDAILRGIAGSLCRGLRATDVACRFGGEELAVVMPHNPLDGCRQMAERWRKRVERSRFDGPGATGMRVTISIGVAAYERGHSSPEDLVASADAALYRAKKGGRNRVEIA